MRVVGSACRHLSIDAIELAAPAPPGHPASYEPNPGIGRLQVGHLLPPLEGGDECVLCNIFGRDTGHRFDATDGRSEVDAEERREVG